MPLEIERKFLVDLTLLELPADGKLICQGYLPVDAGSKAVVRVRISGELAWLTIKGENAGAVRAEFEYPVPLADAKDMLRDLCDPPLIEKTRYDIRVDQHLWQVDVFHGDNQGLVVAEIELESADEAFGLPDWITAEVTHDPRYYNSNLRMHPFSRWGAP